jgi:hypothetical protein
MSGRIGFSLSERFTKPLAKLRTTLLMETAIHRPHADGAHLRIKIAAFAPIPSGRGEEQACSLSGVGRCGKLDQLFALVRIDVFS